MTDEMIVNHLYLAAFSRPPAADETKTLLAAVKDQREGPMARRQAIEDLVWAVLTSKEFLFNH